MHELSIALSLIDIASDELAKLADPRVIAVRVRLGPLSGVVKDALLFSFEVASAGTALAGARLEIEEVPVTIWCPRCAAERALLDVARRRCPGCDTMVADITHGDELQLVGLEIQDR